LSGLFAAIAELSVHLPALAEHRQHIHTMFVQLP
jgi:hypothetical protein